MTLPIEPEYPNSVELFAEWQAAMTRDLKGADFNKKLVTRTHDDLSIEPLYTPEARNTSEASPGLPGTAPHTRASSTLSTSRFGWLIQQRYDVQRADINAAILEDLQKGVSGLHLYSENGDLTTEDLRRALLGVHLNMIPIHVDGGPGSTRVPQLLAPLLDKSSSGGLMQDPIGNAATGHPESPSLEDSIAAMSVFANAASVDFPKMRTASVATQVYHAAGASNPQCLAYAAATAVSYLKHFESSGLPMERAVDAIDFHLALDARFFTGIATIRAWRNIWSKITGACGHAAGAWIRVHPSRRILTTRDPWVNQLRNTATTFAGAVAGANAITTSEWDSPLRPANSLGRRVARNTQLILAQESHLSRVIDPAGGSYFIEKLTQDLTQSAWQIFQNIEKHGGMIACLRDGVIQSQIESVQKSRAADIGKRKLAITGVNEFPNLAEENPPTRSHEPPPTAPNAPSIQALKPRPDAEAFELLRQRSDQVQAQTGHRPRVFLANLGTVAQHTARATFCANLFAAGGLESVASEGTLDVAPIVEQFLAANTPVAALCGTDKLYGQHATVVAAALQKAGAKLLFLAGRPGALEGELRYAGIDDYVYVGCDALLALASAWQAWEANQ